jgi:hypothetical protein
LGQTEKILGILKKILEDPEAGKEGLLALVKKLTIEQVRQCLIYIKDWNTIGMFEIQFDLFSKFSFFISSFLPFYSKI